MMLIDRCGRRRLLLVSLTGVIIALAILTAAFHITSHDSPPINFTVESSYAPLVCSKPAVLSTSHCTQCLQAGCGFCASKGDQVNLQHSFLSIEPSLTNPSLYKKQQPTN